MKIIYVANMRLPTEKAHGFQTMKMCEIFATQGVEVILLAPRRLNPIKENVFDYYGIQKNFRIIFLPALELIRFGFFAANLSFAFSSFIWARKFIRENSRGSSDTVIYGRDILSLFLLSFLGRPVFFEAHDAPRRLLRLWSFMLKKMTGIISQNKWKVDFFHKRLGVGISKIFVYPNGFDPRDFSHIVSKDWAREQLNLPRNVLIILYAGHLYSWKGADTLLKTARRFSEEKSPIPGLFRNNLLFIFVGGTEEDIGRFRKESADLKNVMVAGRRPHREIPLWLFSADILVLPNSAKSEESVWATSPIKLFEYMAAGRPIIASDLPSIRENVSEKEVLFVRPDDPEAIKNGILKIISDPDRARRLAENSKIKSAEFTWQNRAEAILNWINKVV